MNIAIWGTKKEAIYLYQILNRSGRNEVKIFIDNNKSRQSETIDGKYIVSFESLNHLKADETIDTIIIAVRNGFSIYSILNQINMSANKYRVGIMKMEVFDFYRTNEDVSIWEHIIWTDGEKEILPYLQIVLNKRCNLNCKGCTHFANIYNRTKSDWKYEKVQLINDMKTLSLKADVLRLRLLGGEPFLYEDLKVIVEAARQIFPNADIRVVTNGLPLLTVDEKLLETIKQSNIGLDISPYIPTIKIKTKISDLLSNYDINFFFEGIEGENGIEKFCKNINVTGNSSADSAWRRCPHKQCISLLDGKLYKCPNEVFINDFFEYFDINTRINETGIIVDNDFELKTSLEILYGSCSEVCKFCSSEVVEYEWEQNSMPKVSDWNVATGDT